MPIKKESQEKINEKLKQTILNSEEKKEMYFSKFKKIEMQIKQNLKERKTDDALYNLTLGALYL
jgi:hypothetical protein